MPNSQRHYPSGYKLPSKNVLVVSCIDLRLLDEIVAFMEHDNLTNRYDHFILAGASLGACYKAFPEDYNQEKIDKLGLDNFEPWYQSLFQHIMIAESLHKIQDVYIIEHEECGAYREFLNGYNQEDIDEVECHTKYARQLTEQIASHANPSISSLRVHSFLMDLRGNVKLLHTTSPVAA